MSTTTVEPQARVDFRMTESLKSLVEDAAALQGVSLTAFFIEAAVNRAREVKSQHALTVLNDAERDAFLALLASPPDPNPALARTMATEVVL